tara:strand:- start:216 stop:425 length:210 start_codon:yes stop_codon:yes gene_type:complete
MDPATFINLIVGAAAAMTTAIAFLFKTVMTLHENQSDLTSKLGELKGKQKGIEELSNKVLDIVHRNTNQ